MSDRLSFVGEVALITGAASGIGRATARLLTERGAKVVLADRDDTDALAQEIRANGGTAMPFGADLADPAAPAELVDATLAAWGRLDMLVCAAGFLRDKSFAKMPAEDFDVVVHMHLTSVAACARAAWPILQRQGDGRILLFTSHAGLFGNFGQANYAAAKLGVVGLMQTLAIEGERYGIRVNAIAPLAATPLAAGTAIDALAEHLSPDDVAATAAFLCHREAQATGRIVAAAGARIALATIAQSDPVDAFPQGEPTIEAVASAWRTLGVSSDAPSGAAKAAEPMMRPARNCTESADAPLPG